ncbi:MAG: hypothetical protein ABGY96_05570 [bacterium]|nr:hypothetical protein [Gammaproteobacteria bacterium]HIL96869.1 hypothetical protein [Pseudomonadales bacterium]
MFKNPIVPVFAFLLGLFSLVFAIKSPDGAFVGNMLPELIGFCLEGIFFIGIFTWIQERKDRERKKELKQSLAGAIGFICPIINSTLPEDKQIKLLSNDNWTRQTRKNGKSLKALLGSVNNNDIDVSSEQIKAIQQLLLTRLSTLDSLLSIAAELSHSHLSAYNMILTEIHKVAEHHYFESAQLKSSFLSLLRLLVSFNNETL